ncbi:MAG: histidinol-phosphate transaminase [Acidobacteria bacterium]|nr:histidinol-phosphate transaminase [Acidobacteriota bacterium]
MKIENLVRANIKTLKPYSSARKEFTGKGEVFLDANENSFGSPLPRAYNRYPDPLQTEIKRLLAPIVGVHPEQLFVGNGSDEAIDLLFRIFCEPRQDNVVICPPTYGMYEVSAAINDVAVRRAPLTNEFRLDTGKIGQTIDGRTKLIFICSPNNPTGNAFPREDIIGIARGFDGIVVVDEAYFEFARGASIASEIGTYPNLVVLRTFSKAWGLAGLRTGFAIANEEVIRLFNNVKPPYNVSQIAQEAIVEALGNRNAVELMIDSIIAEREILKYELNRLPFVSRVYPSDANFVLVRTADADSIYRFLLDERIVVRNRNTVELCEGCLRITIGTPVENQQLLRALKRFKNL